MKERIGLRGIRQITLSDVDTSPPASRLGDKARERARLEAEEAARVAAVAAAEEARIQAELEKENKDKEARLHAERVEAENTRVADALRNNRINARPAESIDGGIVRRSEAINWDTSQFPTQNIFRDGTRDFSLSALHSAIARRTGATMMLPPAVIDGDRLQGNVANYVREQYSMLSGSGFAHDVEYLFPSIPLGNIYNTQLFRGAAMRCDSSISMEMDHEETAYRIRLGISHAEPQLTSSRVYVSPMRVAYGGNRPERHEHIYHIDLPRVALVFEGYGHPYEVAKRGWQAMADTKRARVHELVERQRRSSNVSVHSLWFMGVEYWYAIHERDAGFAIILMDDPGTGIRASRTINTHVSEAQKHRVAFAMVFELLDIAE